MSQEDKACSNFKYTENMFVIIDNTKKRVCPCFYKYKDVCSIGPQPVSYAGSWFHAGVTPDDEDGLSILSLYLKTS